jgi:hypothetical protein
MRAFIGVPRWICALVLVSATSALPLRAIPSGSLSREFELRYRAWRTEIGPSYSDDVDSGMPPFARPSAARDRLVALGVSSIPVAIERSDEYGVPFVLRCITKWRLDRRRARGLNGERIWVYSEFPDVSRSDRDSFDGRRLAWRWWEEAEVLVPRLFAERYRLWKEAATQGSATEVARQLDRLRDLGVWALPLMIEKVRGGDGDLIASVSYLTDRALPEDATAAECLRWWDEHKADWRVPPPPKERITDEEKAFLKGWRTTEPTVEAAARAASICMRRWLSKEQVVSLVGPPDSATSDGQAVWAFAPGLQLGLQFGKSGYVVAATLSLTDEALKASGSLSDLTDQEREVLRHMHTELSLTHVARVAAICVNRRLTREEVVQRFGSGSPLHEPTDGSVEYRLPGKVLVYRFDEQGRMQSATVRQPDVPMPPRGE